MGRIFTRSHIPCSPPELTSAVALFFHFRDSDFIRQFLQSEHSCYWSTAVLEFELLANSVQLQSCILAAPDFSFKEFISKVKNNFQTSHWTLWCLNCNPCLLISCNKQYKYTWGVWFKVWEVQPTGQQRGWMVLYAQRVAVRQNHKYLSHSTAGKVFEKRSSLEKNMTWTMDPQQISQLKGK